MASSLHRPNYASWCVDSAESSPAASTVSEDFLKQEPNGSNQLLILLPSEISGGLTKAKTSPKPPEPSSTMWTHHNEFTQSQDSRSYPVPNTPPTLHISSEEWRNPHTDYNTGTNSYKNEDEGEYDNSKKSKNDDRKGEEDLSLLDPMEKSFKIPRSSPVICRRRKGLSWNGSGADSPASSSSPCPASSPLCPDHFGLQNVNCVDKVGSKPSSSKSSSPVQRENLSYVSVSSSLNCLLSVGLHLPLNGQHGLAEEHKGRDLTSSDISHKPGCSTSSPELNKERSSKISEFCTDVINTSCDLDKENAHFIVVDMVLEVLESVKWTLSFERQTPATHTQQNTQCKLRTHRHTRSAPDLEEDERRHLQCCRGAGAQRDNNEHTRVEEHMEQSLRIMAMDAKKEETPENDVSEHQQKTLSVLSTDSGFEDGGFDKTLTQRSSIRKSLRCPMMHSSAEWLAQQLVLNFRTTWFPVQEFRRGRQSLRSSLQELPGTGDVTMRNGSLIDEIRLRTRMRGTVSWAPPRFQIIFTVQPTHRRSEVVASQHFLCAGCGTEVEPRYIKKLRYCEYLGKYFCDCCHSGSEAIIPGRVLSCWDFGRFPVSDFSKQLLDLVWRQPLYDLTCVGKTLYSRVKELDKFRELQEQLLNIKKLLRACRLSEGVMVEFEQLPGHLTEQSHLFSMDDLLRVKKGQLVAVARTVLQAATEHVQNCKLCLARGFICEFCRKKDIIFPFQNDTCKRCPVCKACFHKLCFVEKRSCPKCVRIQSRIKCQNDMMQDE